ncbi:MAG: hypothetical protein SGCHY_002224 [Lobulomycetales sp.]
MQDFVSKRVRLFRNGDIYTPAKKLVVSPRIFRNYEQFLHSASKELKLLNGAVRKVYDITGKPVQSLDDIKDGAAYVATGGEFFKRAPYLEQEKIQSLPPKPRKTYGSPIKPFLLASESGPATNGRKETPIFNSNVRPPQANHPARMQSKAYRVVVYVNGDAGVPGRRLLLNHRTCKSFSQLLRVVSDSVKTQTSIRRLYNIKTGRQITRLSELSDGMSIAAAGGGGFKRVAYKPKTPLDIGQKRVAEEPRRVVSFFPNGDGQHAGYIVSLQASRFPNLARLLTHINSKFTLVNGPCRRIYSLTGEIVSIISDLEHGEGYVLVSGDDQFYRIEYNVNQMAAPVGPRGMAGYTQHNEMMGRIKLARPIWEVQAEKRAAAKRAPAGKQPGKAAAGKPVQAAPRKGRREEEIREEIVAADDAYGDDDEAVFESREIAQFNPVEAVESELEINEDKSKPAMQQEDNTMDEEFDEDNEDFDEEEVEEEEDAAAEDEAAGAIASTGSLNDEAPENDEDLEQEDDLEEDVKSEALAESSAEEEDEEVEAAEAKKEPVETYESDEDDNDVEEEDLEEEQIADKDAEEDDDEDDDDEEADEVEEAVLSKQSSIASSLPLVSQPTSQGNLQSQRSLGSKSRIPVRSSQDVSK